MEDYAIRRDKHVYVNDGLEAVKAYKDAFKLEAKSEPWLDNEGVLIYQELQLNGGFFISVSDFKHLEAEMKKERLNNVKTTILNTVYFLKREDLRKAFEILYKEGNPYVGLRVSEIEKYDTAPCDIVMIDKFDVLWHLCVPVEWDLPAT